MQQLTLKATGIHCGGCEDRIATALATIDGVIRSCADHETGQVTVVIDPARTTEEAVRSTVERAGFEVAP